MLTADLAMLATLLLWRSMHKAWQLPVPLALSSYVTVKQY